jgi:hypothetical protein
MQDSSEGDGRRREEDVAREKRRLKRRRSEDGNADADADGHGGDDIWWHVRWSLNPHENALPPLSFNRASKTPEGKSSRRDDHSIMRYVVH